MAFVHSAWKITSLTSDSIKPTQKGFWIGQMNVKTQSVHHYGQLGLTWASHRQLFFVAFIFFLDLLILTTIMILQLTWKSLLQSYVNLYLIYIATWLRLNSFILVQLLSACLDILIFGDFWFVSYLVTQVCQSWEIDMQPNLLISWLQCRKFLIVLSLPEEVLIQNGVLFEQQWDTQNHSNWPILPLGMKIVEKNITEVHCLLYIFFPFLVLSFVWVHRNSHLGEVTE